MVKCPLCNPLYTIITVYFSFALMRRQKILTFFAEFAAAVIANLMLTTNDCTILKFTDIIFYLLLFESTGIDGCKPKILTNFLDFFEICPALKHLN